MYISRQVTVRAHVPERKEGKTKGRKGRTWCVGVFRSPALTEQAGSQASRTSANSHPPSHPDSFRCAAWRHWAGFACENSSVVRIQLTQCSLQHHICAIRNMCLFCSCTGVCSEGLEALLVLIPGNFSPFQVGGGGKKRKNPENSLPSQSPSMQAGQALQGTSPSLFCSELRLGLGPVR